MVWGCLIVGLILFLIARFSVKGKGEYGEDRIYDILQKVDGYKATLPNCYLPKGNGETAEVDLIFLHESGIYVFESKNYSGWIFGSENQKYWTQSFSDRRGGTKNISSTILYGKMIHIYVHFRKLYRMRM